MARSNEDAEGPRIGMVRRAWTTLLASRPALALAAAWLTTAGHTMNFREMNAARGWVTAQGYGLHSIFLIAIVVTLLAAPHAARRFGSYLCVVLGLGLLAVGATWNMVLTVDVPGLAEFGRVIAGVGAGLVIASGPRVLHPGSESYVAWAGIILPAAGPVIVAFAADGYGWYSWEGGFVFEAVLAILALAAVLSIADPPEFDPVSEASPAADRGSLRSLPAVAVGALAVWHIMHWGQLYGWLEGPTIIGASVVASVSFCLALWLAWPSVDPVALREALPRLGLMTYGGFVQYFNASDMGVYGGLLINFSPLMRSWLVCSLSIGSAAALGVGRLLWPRRSPGYTGACLGLLVLAGGMALSHWNTLNWPFWRVLNVVEFNWFAAPQHWQLAPPRFLMGFGSGMVLLAMTTRSSPDPSREAMIRPFLPVAQFAGGALSVGALVTVLLAAHQLEYSYVADRGFIQPTEQEDRRALVAASLTERGAPAPAQQASSLLFRAVNYEADNFVFADIYGGFFVASVALAVPCGVRALAGRLGSKRQPASPEAVSR